MQNRENYDNIPATRRVADVTCGFCKEVMRRAHRMQEEI